MPQTPVRVRCVVGQTYESFVVQPATATHEPPGCCRKNLYSGALHPLADAPSVMDEPICCGRMGSIEAESQMSRMPWLERMMPPLPTTHTFCGSQNAAPYRSSKYVTCSSVHVAPPLTVMSALPRAPTARQMASRRQSTPFSDDVMPEESGDQVWPPFPLLMINPLDPVA